MTWRRALSGASSTSSERRTSLISLSTLGGNVATNAGGIKGAKYGTTKDYVLALEVAEMLKIISDMAKKYNLKIPTVGHIGDGNLHPTISFDGTDPDQMDRVEKASEDLYNSVLALGGTLTGEHGIVLDKAPFMTQEHDAVAMEVMRALKRLFDPNNILNRGKMDLEA